METNISGKPRRLRKRVSRHKKKSLKALLGKLDLLAIYAASARAAYVFERRQHESRRTGVASYKLPAKWDGGRDIHGKKHRPVWPKIAVFMLRNRLNPVACVKFLFARILGTDKQVYPNQITSVVYLDDYKRMSRLSDRHLKNMFKFEQNLCKTEISSVSMFIKEKRDAWQYVLLHDQLDLSPLFRFCVGYSENFAPVVEQYLCQAVVQYLSAAEAYDRVWEHWIPAEFKKAAMSLLETELTRGDRNGL